MPVPTNETLITIANRHSIRKFQDTPIPNEMIEAILKAANSAPSAHNQQSWRFFIISENKKKELVELVSQKAAEFPRPAAVLLRMAARSIASAPVTIGIANTGELIRHGGDLFGLTQNSEVTDFFRTMEIQSSAAAVQNLLLAATSLGLATVWLGILFLIKNEVLELLGEPQGEFMAVVPIGYPERESKGPGKKPLNTIVKYISE